MRSMEFLNDYSKRFRNGSKFAGIRVRLPETVPRIVSYETVLPPTSLEWLAVLGMALELDQVRAQPGIKAELLPTAHQHT